MGKAYKKFNIVLHGPGVTGKVAGHEFKPWKQPLVEMQDKAAYNRPLRSPLSRTLHIAGDYVHRVCPMNAHNSKFGGL